MPWEGNIRVVCFLLYMLPDYKQRERPIKEKQQYKKNSLHTMLYLLIRV